MFDGDFAGSEATLKSGQILLQQGFNVFVVQLPKTWTRMSILENTVQMRLIILWNMKKAFILYKVHMHQEEIENNDLAYERYLKEITNDISLMKSSILRKKILQDVSELFKVSMDSLNNEVGLREDYYQPQSYQMPSVPQFTHLNKQEKAERALLKHFMNDKDIFKLS